jgi:hypothetical protein
MTPVDRASGPRYPSRPVLQPMNEALERSPVAPPELGTRSGVGLFREALREKPVSTAAGLVLEYLTFASAVFLALSLYLTRHPMAFLDRVLGLRLRERFVELIAKVSPG